MKRATFTIPDDLEARLNRYFEDQNPAPSLTSLMQTALRRFLDEQQLATREYRTAKGKPRITPISDENGPRDVGVHHDRYLAEAAMEKLERSRRSDR